MDIKEFVKKKENWIRLVSMLLFFVMSYMGIKFCNAGHSYEQDHPFRIFCICFSILVLINLPKKDVLTIGSLLFIPLCYVATHYGYEYHIIPDNCDYKFVDLIRLGKLVALGWGLMIIALLKHIIRLDLPREFLLYLRKVPRMKKLLLLGWCGYVALFTVVNPGYAYLIVFTIGFSAFFIISRKPERQRLLFAAFSDGVLLCFMMVSVRAMMHRPYDTERYLFYFSNENMAGMYLAAMLVTVIARLHAVWTMAKSRLRTFALVFLHALLVWNGILIFYNYTRTYLFGMIFAFLGYLILLLKKSDKKKRTLGRFFLPVVLTILSLYPGYLILRHVPAVFSSPRFFYGEEFNETRVHPGDPADSPKYTSLARYLTLSFGKWGIDLHIEDGQEELAEEEGVVSINSERDVSNGRIYVWKLFLSHMTIDGHYPGDITEEDGHVIYHAHNTYFQNMFQYGIPAGLYFGLGIFLLWLYAAIRFAKEKDTDASLVFSFLGIGVVMIGMLTEWSGHPVYPFGILMMLAISRLFCSGAEDKEAAKADPAKA